MSLTNPLTSSDDLVRVTAVSPRQAKVVWTQEMERKLLDILLEQVGLGRKGEGGFRKEAWSIIKRRFNEEMKMNLVRDNFKNKLKTWKVGYLMMKDLRNMSGFAWNESTQCVDADETVWDELLMRKDFKNARVYKRQPFLYFNDLAVIVGNDMANGYAARTAQETEDEHLFEESVDLEDGAVFTSPMDDTLEFDEEFLHPNDSSASVRQNPSTPSSSSSRRPKKRKTSMAASLDIICQSIQGIGTGIRETHSVKVDQGETKEDIAAAFAALKTISGLSRETMFMAYDTFTSEPLKAWGFLQMSAEEKEAYVRFKFGRFQ